MTRSDQTFAANIEPGMMVKCSIDWMELPIYAEHPLLYLARKLKGSTSENPWPTSAMLKKNRKDAKKDVTPDKLGLLKVHEVALVLGVHGGWVLATTGSVVGWMMKEMLCDARNVT